MGITDKIMEQFEADASTLFDGHALPASQINRFHGTTGLLLIEMSKRCAARCEAGSLKAVVIKNFRTILFCVTLVLTAFATGQWPRLMDFINRDKPAEGLVNIEVRP